MDELNKQISENSFQAYYGGKNGYDYCCLKNEKIIYSGNKESMIEYASKNDGVYVAILIPVTFTRSKYGS